MKEFHVSARRAHFDPDSKNPRAELFTKPSLTIPDQVLPLKTLLDRYANGQLIQTFQPVYSEKAPPGIEMMDEIERIQASRELKASIEATRAQLAAKANNKKQDSTAQQDAPSGD